MKRVAHIEGNWIVNVSLARDDAELLPGQMLEAEALAAGYTRAPSLVGDDLANRRLQMAAILDALPIEVQASLWTTRVAVEQALDRGRLDVARALVEATVVPPELEATKAEILGLFPEV